MSALKIFDIYIKMEHGLTLVKYRQHYMMKRFIKSGPYWKYKHIYRLSNANETCARVSLRGLAECELALYILGQYTLFIAYNANLHCHDHAFELLAPSPTSTPLIHWELMMKRALADAILLWDIFTIESWRRCPATFTSPPSRLADRAQLDISRLWWVFLRYWWALLLLYSFIYHAGSGLTLISAWLPLYYLH